MLKFEKNLGDGVCEDDGYLKALKATTGKVPADWEQQKIRTQDDILEGLDDKMKQLSR